MANASRNPKARRALLQKPISDRAVEDARLLALIRASHKASHGIYGAPRIFLDLREAGETCSKHRVERIMRVNKIVALHGYRTRHYSVGKPSVLIPNLVKRQFNVEKANRIWATDITYIRTWEGWLYLAVVMDLFSRKIVGWAATLGASAQMTSRLRQNGARLGSPRKPGNSNVTTLGYINLASYEATSASCTSHPNCVPAQNQAFVYTGPASIGGAVAVGPTGLAVAGFAENEIIRLTGTPP